MSIAAYSDLKTKAASWLRRSGNATFVAEVPDMITFGEARLNAELGPVQTEATLTGTVSSRSLDLTALTIEEPIALWLTPGTGLDEVGLDQQSPEQMPYAAANSEPTMWAYDSEDAIKLNCPCDQAYSFRFRYKGVFHLSDSATTNWVLEHRPDIYLAATLGWGSAYLENFAGAGQWASYLDKELPRAQHTLARGRRGTLRIDPSLVVMGGGRYNIETDG